MYIGFLIHYIDKAITYGEDKKNGLIKQFFSDVAWAELDYFIMIINSSFTTTPGSVNEHFSIV